MAHRFLILGGYGHTGLPLARLLLEETDTHLILAGRHQERAQRAADDLNHAFAGSRVSGIQLDASDREGLAEAFKSADFVISASATAHHAGLVARTALEAGIDYLDVHYSSAKLAELQEMAPAVQQAGRCFITEAGFHPGLPAALVRFAAARLDRVEVAVVAAVLNPEGGIPFTESFTELVEEFRNYQALVYRDGEWRKVGWFSTKDLLRMDFGDLKRRYCYPMMLEEMRALPQMLPGVSRVGFYMAGVNWVADWVITPLAMGGLFLAPRRAVRPLARLVWWSWTAFSHPPYGIALQARVTGTAEGRPAEVAVVLRHTDGYLLTVIPVVACLQQYLDGSIRRPGLWMMGHLVDPQRLLTDMERMGISVRVAGGKA